MGPFVLGLAGAAFFLGIYELLTVGLVRETIPHWTGYLSALGTVAVGFLAATIADRQARTERNKLKLDLFNQRLKVFVAARWMIGVALTHAKVKNEDIHVFLTDTREARWLLNQEIADYLDNVLHEKASALHAWQETFSQHAPQEEREKNMKAQTDLAQWFREQIGVLDRMFSPYLQLSH